MTSIYSILFALFGVVAVSLSHFDIYFPIWLSVVIMFFVWLFLLQQYRQKRLGLLVILFYLVYSLPFIHTLEYMWFDFSQNPSILWGLAVNPYMTDERIIKLLTMIGAVGGLGVAFGVSLAKTRIQKNLILNKDSSRRRFRTMAMPIWLAWVFIGLVLTVLSAPQETIFTASYTQSSSLLANFNFNSSWMVSYVMLSFAFCDALFQPQSITKIYKTIVILLVLIVITFFYQLLRGDRESISWLIGLILVYFYWLPTITQVHIPNIPWLKIIGFTFALFALSMVVGAIRSGLTGATLADAILLVSELYESGDIGFFNLLNGTWSAVLLTPLSVAGDHINGLLPVKWGQSYLDLLFSIIPGFLSDAIGYIRPIDANSGASWQMRYGLGGTHATVLPFMNFRMLGVFLFSASYAYITSRYEKMVLLQPNVINISLLCILCMAFPHWLWYGEKNIINALLIWLIFKFLYRVSLGLNHFSLDK